MSNTEPPDVVVVGDGVAGRSAAIFTARHGLETVVLGTASPILRRNAHLENYPGFPAGVDARLLLEMMADQAERAGCTLERAEVTRVDVAGVGPTDEVGGGSADEVGDGPTDEVGDGPTDEVGDGSGDEAGDGSTDEAGDGSPDGAGDSSPDGAGDSSPDEARFVVETAAGDRWRSASVVAATKNAVGYLAHLDGVEILDRGKTFVRVDERGRTGVEGLYAAGRLAGKPHQAVVAAGHGAEVAVTLLEDDDRPFYHDWVAPDRYFTGRDRDVPPGCEEVDEAEHRRRERESLAVMAEYFAEPHPETPDQHPSVAEDAGSGEEE